MRAARQTVPRRRAFPPRYFLLLPARDARGFLRPGQQRLATGRTVRAISQRVSANSSLLLGACRTENARDRFSNPLPTGMLRREMPPARGGQAVKFCAPVICGSSPFAFDPSFLQEPLERGIERAVLDLENVLRGLLDELGDAVAVHRPPAKRAQDEQVQGSLQEVEPFVGREFGCHG